MSKIADHEYVIKLRDQGLSIYKIADLVGVSPQRIDQILKVVNKNGRLPHNKKPVRKKITLEEKINNFWNRVDTKEKDKCWIWQGSKGDYGYCKLDGKRTSVHRLAWELTHGSIPVGMFVCHKCDKPLCINPDHLFLGTPQDNTNDAIRKGRRKRKSNNGPVITVSLRPSPEEYEAIKKISLDLNMTIPKAILSIINSYSIDKLPLDTQL